MSKIKNVLTKTRTSVMLALFTLMNVSVVRADGFDGTLGSTMEQLKPVTDKIGPLFSGILNVGFAVTAAVAAAKAIMLYIQMNQESNPNEAKNKKEAAMKSLIACAVAVVGTVLINVLLGLLGLGGFFKFAV